LLSFDVPIPYLYIRHKIEYITLSMETT
jgi:hypothetical protein